MREPHEYTFILKPYRDPCDYSPVDPRRERKVRLRVVPPLVDSILKVLVLNQRGTVVCEAVAYKPLRNINDLLKLGLRLQSLLMQKKSRVRRPYLVVVNSRGELVFERQFESLESITMYTGQEIGFASEECDYQPRSVAA